MNVILFDYGVGNLHSLGKALEAAGADVRVTTEIEVGGTDAIVLPGVGAFGPAAEALAPHRAALRDAFAGGLPGLGICLGMQLLFDASDEADGAGLGVVPGRVTRIDAPVVPHMGWNDVEAGGDPLFAGIGTASMYFANSFECRPDDPAAVVCTSRYGQGSMATGVRTGNTWGVQFHPEKSSTAGRRLLANFLAEVYRIRNARGTA